MKKGFTLIELLVTMMVIIILISVSLFAVAGARGQGRDAKRKSDLETIRSGLELYKADCGIYPPGPFAIGAVVNGTGGSSSCALGNTYISAWPGDPQNPTRTYYYNRPTTTTYQLCAALEGGGTGICTGACGVACNYLTNNP